MSSVHPRSLNANAFHPSWPAWALEWDESGRLNVSYHKNDEPTYSPILNYLVHSLKYEDDSVNGLVRVQHADGFEENGAGIFSLRRHRRQRRKCGRHDCCYLFAFKQSAIGIGDRAGFAGLAPHRPTICISLFRVWVVRRKMREEITVIRRYESNQIVANLSRGGPARKKTSAEHEVWIAFRRGEFNQKKIDWPP